MTSIYVYDPIYQLTQVLQGATTTESYTYDATGNRLTSADGTLGRHHLVPGAQAVRRYYVYAKPANQSVETFQTEEDSEP